MKGSVINVTRFCTDDGPGIRTTVFLKGCPLSCAWCHNPESQKAPSEIFYDEKKCVLCRACETVCRENRHTFAQGVHTFDLAQCSACGDCAVVCPTKALEMIGKTVCVEEIVNEVKKDAVFYQTSGGGVTLSGGEPLFQTDFCVEILRACKTAGIHTAIETSGFASERDFLRVLEYCDFVLFDVKDTDEERHIRNTGVSLQPIMRNLRLLDEKGVPFVLRLPIVPTFNDDLAHFANVKALAGTLRHCQGVEVMPYHTLGEYKYRLLQRPYACAHIKNPSVEQTEKWKSYFL